MQQKLKSKVFLHSLESVQEDFIRNYDFKLSLIKDAKDLIFYTGIAFSIITAALLTY